MDSQLKLMQKAVKQGDVSILVRLFSSSKDTCLLSSKDANGNTPLHFAACHGHIDIIKLLVKLGAESDKENEYGWTPLMLSCFYGHFAICQYLLGLKTTQIDKFNSLGLNPLKCAIYNGHVEILNLLIERKADVNQSHGHLSPLMIACKVKNHEAVQTLLKNNVDCNYQNKSNGWTAIFYAIHKDDYSLVQMLVTANAEKDLKSWSGKTAKDLAEELGCDTEALFGEISSDTTHSKIDPNDQISDRSALNNMKNFISNRKVVNQRNSSLFNVGGHRDSTLGFNRMSIASPNLANIKSIKANAISNQSNGEKNQDAIDFDKQKQPGLKKSTKWWTSIGDPAKK